MNSAHIIAAAIADHLRKSFADLHASAHSDYSPEFKRSECTKISSCLISSFNSRDGQHVLDLAIDSVGSRNAPKYIDYVAIRSEIANMAEIFINRMYSDQSELAIVACRPRKSTSRQSNATIKWRRSAVPIPLNLHIWVHGSHIIALFASSDKITQISSGHCNIIHEDLLSPDSVTNIQKWSSDIIRTLLDAVT